MLTSSVPSKMLSCCYRRTARAAAYTIMWHIELCCCAVVSVSSPEGAEREEADGKMLSVAGSVQNNLTYV